MSMLVTSVRKDRTADNKEKCEEHNGKGVGNTFLYYEMMTVKSLWYEKQSSDT